MAVLSHPTSRHRYLAALGLAILAALTLVLSSASAAGAAASSSPSTNAVAAAAWSGCPVGDVCFWDGGNGTGARCQWAGEDNNWSVAPGVCSWASKGTPVKSVWNRGTSSALTGVVYYFSTNYQSRIGCTKQGQRGNLAGTYAPRSHRWINGACG
jgi:hypothetical protein